MIELNIETISIILACGSIIIGVASVVDKNRREIKTRQANILMQINQYLTSTHYQKNWMEVMWFEKWSTFQEYEARYGLGEHLEESVKVTINSGDRYLTTSFKKSPEVRMFLVYSAGKMTIDFSFR